MKPVMGRIEQQLAGQGPAPREAAAMLARLNESATRAAARSGAVPRTLPADELETWAELVDTAFTIPRRQLVLGDGGAGASRFAARAMALPELPFPFLGRHVPGGWKVVQEYLVDVTGLATGEGAALTIPEFVAEVRAHAGAGWAVCEVGPLVAIVGRFARAVETDEVPETVAPAPVPVWFEETPEA